MVIIYVTFFMYPQMPFAWAFVGYWKVVWGY